MAALKCKSLYRGTFNLAQTVFIERVQAFSIAQAHFLFCNRIARRRGVPARNIMRIFDGTRPNFEISLEMEFTIDEENG